MTVYDIALRLTTLYEQPVIDARHDLRVRPLNDGLTQRLDSFDLAIWPSPSRRHERIDYFANGVTSVTLAEPHTVFEMAMMARVERFATRSFSADLPLQGLKSEIAACRDMGFDAPHHYLGESPHIPFRAEIRDYAHQAMPASGQVQDMLTMLMAAIHRDFAFDDTATTVETALADAFWLRRGVCQDFAHVMIACLRSIGIPAGYVSGFLRTEPPDGQMRLEGADAMHAWVRAWCGQQAGWVECDPTNDIFVNDNHIAVAHGRDYDDALPIVGFVSTAGVQQTKQAVDVIPVCPDADPQASQHDQTQGQGHEIGAR